jgi:aminopeptidase N
VSKKSLQKFFHQWLEGEGEIELEFKVSTNKEMDLFETILNIEQVQEEYKYYEFPLEVRLNFSNSEPITHKIPVNTKFVRFKVKTNTEPILIEIDPNNWLLASITEE